MSESSPNQDDTTQLDKQPYVSNGGHETTLADLLYKARRRDVDIKHHDDGTITYGNTTYHPATE